MVARFDRNGDGMLSQDDRPHFGPRGDGPRGHGPRDGSGPRDGGMRWWQHGPQDDNGGPANQ